MIELSEVMGKTAKNDDCPTESGPAVNISNKELTGVKESVPSNGMKFSVIKKTLKPEQFILCIQTALEDCGEKAAQLL
ncbi:unnamed protein product [Heterobilharzia americana]|nr:unnamed protein product [Heterobilharzia americana]